MPFLIVLERIGVDLGHDERHLAVHAPLRGIVDHDRALGCDLGRPLLGHARACRHQADVGALEIEIVERLHLQHRVAERNVRAVERVDASATTSLAGNRRSARTLSISPPDIAGRADDGDFVGHKSVLPGFGSHRGRNKSLRARTHIAMHESAKEAISQRVPAAGTRRAVYFGAKTQRPNNFHLSMAGFCLWQYWGR